MCCWQSGMEAQLFAAMDKGIHSHCFLAPTTISLYPKRNTWPPSYITSVIIPCVLFQFPPLSCRPRDQTRFKNVSWVISGWTTLISKVAEQQFGTRTQLGACDPTTIITVLLNLRSKTSGWQKSVKKNRRWLWWALTNHHVIKGMVSNWIKRLGTERTDVCGRG